MQNGNGKTTNFASSVLVFQVVISMILQTELFQSKPHQGAQSKIPEPGEDCSGIIFTTTT